MKRCQRGMSLVAAIFLIVIIALLSAFAVSVGTATTDSANQQLYGDRARAAAEAGLEWAAYRAMVQGACLANYPPLVLNQGALRGFRVTLSCQRATSVNVYDITAFAQRGNFGAVDYASHRVVRRFN
jgi:MSHA biogenesis protein MshP